jgi:hypothetical protein
MIGIRSRADVANRQNIGIYGSGTSHRCACRNEVAETITKPEMMAAEAVFIMFIVAPPDLSCWTR